MMRSPRYFAVAVRAPNQQIVLHTEALAKTWIARQQWLKKPFLRGTLALLDAMALGIRAMQFASNVQLDPRYEAKPEEDGPAEVVTGGPNESLYKGTIIATMVFGLALGLFLFVFLPNLVGEQLKHVGVTDGTALNFASGLLKFVIFLGYIWLISRAEQVKRVFRYHGAEHKAINALEADQELTLGNCAAQTRLHPRCGTSFAIVVLIIDVVLMTFVPRRLFPDLGTFINLLARFGLNLLLLAPIAGIAYELIRFAGRQRNKRYVTALFAPGLATQYLTTAEPDDSQIEVALAALKAVVDAEQNGLPAETDSAA